MLKENITLKNYGLTILSGLVALKCHIFFNLGLLKRVRSFFFGIVVNIV